MSLVKYRSYRGSVLRAVPSMFLWELPREEMEVAMSNGLGSLRPDLESDEFLLESEPCGAPAPRAVSTPRTAAELLGSGHAQGELPAPTPVDPDVFRVGMTVIHPQYGPGKIAALSGQGPRRTGTINFATAGQKQFVLAKSPLRPLSAG